MIKVLVVEDSPVVQEFLVYLLSSDPQIEVIGRATDGEDAIKAVNRIRPDVITMDIQMPKMNGFEATRNIMATCPTPIVIVSGNVDTKEMTITFHAIQAGALAVVARPAGIGHPEHETTAAQFLQTVKLMSEVKVVRRWDRSQREKRKDDMVWTRSLQKTQVVAIGASTGGPQALQSILSHIPKNFPVPLLIVQHMAPGFINGFVEWLGGSAEVPVHVATHDEYMTAGHVYVAPDGFHMTVKLGNLIALTQDEPSEGMRPSVSRLFESVNKLYGPNAIGVLLTGMGKDGALQLKYMKDQGSITVAQDQESSVVFGMPGEAVRLDAAMHVLPPEEIATLLTTLLSKRNEV